MMWHNQASKEMAVEQTEDLNLKHRLLAELSLAVAHETRDPLAVLRGYTQLLLSNEPGKLNVDQTRIVTEIDRTTEELRSSFDLLLDVQRALVGELTLQFEDIDLGELLQEAQSDDLELDIPQKIPPIWADRYRLAHVFRFLLSREMLGWTEDALSVQIRYDPDWVKLEIISAGPESYLANEAYLDPMKFYCQTVIEKHNGKYRMMKSGEGLEVAVMIPVAPHQTSA